MKMHRLYLLLFFALTIFISCQKESVQPASEELSQTIPSVCSPLRTQTPGGWGSTPRGNNPGSYLYQNFETVFGSLTIGCTNGATLTVTSPMAITKLLPTGGKAGVLGTSYTDPSGIKNVLVGHLIALTLSVGFDNFDSNFGGAPTNLDDMIIGSGTFSGKTVEQFLAIANDVIGGCNTDYSIQDVLTTATLINENYVDGKTDNGFLTCPDNTPR